jgi:hypothetical protein
MNWKTKGRKRPWPKLRYYSAIDLRGLRKTTKLARITVLRGEI